MRFRSFAATRTLFDLEQWMTATSIHIVQKWQFWQWVKEALVTQGCICVWGKHIPGWVDMHAQQRLETAQARHIVLANHRVIQKTQGECKKARWKEKAWRRQKNGLNFESGPYLPWDRQQRTEAILAPGAWAKPQSSLTLQTKGKDWHTGLKIQDPPICCLQR